MGYRSHTSNLKMNLRHDTPDERRIVAGILEAYEGYVEINENDGSFEPYEEDGRQYDVEELMEALKEHLKIGSYIELTGEDAAVTRWYIGRRDDGNRAVYTIAPEIKWPRNNQELLEWKN